MRVWHDENAKLSQKDWRKRCFRAVSKEGGVADTEGFAVMVVIWQATK